MSDGPIPFELAIARGRRIRELPATERPRERLQLRGAAGLTAAELIGLLFIWLGYHLIVRDRGPSVHPNQQRDRAEAAAATQSAAA